MSVQSAPPPFAQLIHKGLILIGIVGSLVAFFVIGYIAQQYITREELRNPPVNEHIETSAH